MSTAVEEQQDATAEGELLVQSKPNVMFRSARKNLRLTMEARYPIVNPVTQRPAGVTKGKFVAFRETAKGGLLTFAEKGPVKLIDTLDGNEAEMPAEELIEYLEGHRLFGDRFDGFWRETIEAPAVTREEVQVLMDAALEFDEDKLNLLIEQEEQGWGRSELLDTARGAVERIVAAKAKVAAEAGATPDDPEPGAE
jgi:hypothetical protein